MAIYVYNQATGALFSWCPNDTDPVAPANVLSAQGLVAESGLSPLDASHVWDADTKTVLSVTPPAPPNWIETYQFILLFTPTEHQAIFASADPRVQQFITALQVAQRVNLSDPIIQNAVSYLVSLNLLTQANATLILSGQASQ